MPEDERVVESAGQQHLFELSPAIDTDSIGLADRQEPPEDSADTRRRRRPKRKLDLDHLPHHRHELDVSDEEKVCSCCEQPKEQMGEDITTVLEYEPSRRTMSRSRDGPQKFLKKFRGYLQADAYAGYDAIFLGSGQEVVEVACWAHARRKFFDAVKNYPRQSHQVLEWIWQLYDIEDRALPLTAAERCDLRCADANPILDKLEAYLKELASSVLPKSSLAKAVTYARNQWDALRCYTTDGRLTIDNNTAERTLRHQAVGQKNWLFLGSENAGSRAAILYTIMAGAKRHHIEPWAYVRDVLIRLREDDVELEELLPDRWAAKHPESILTHRIEESRYKANAKRDRRKLRRSLAKACAP